MRGDYDPIVLEATALDALLAELRGRGYACIGPRVRDEAIVLGPVETSADLPVGLVDEQGPGRYRLADAGRPALFDYTVPAQGWKRYLWPPEERLVTARRTDDGFTVEAEPLDDTRHALVGVRACECAAIAVQERVFAGAAHPDRGFVARRRAAFVVAVDCARPAASCFCVSMDTGPRVEKEYDIVLTELLGAGGHRFVAEAGSDVGAEVLATISNAPAKRQDLDAARAVSESARRAVEREIPDGVHALLARNLEHPHWDDVAERCLACGNCTMVCPTCFCNAVVDTTDLGGGTAERWRRWESCFTREFSYVYGGAVRRSTASRYRQWITHKLSTWHEQFGSSGCVGCGRCITWCPVGIDITAEARAIAAADTGG